MYSPAKTPLFPASTFSKHFVAAAGMITAALGLTVLTGWYARIPALVQLRPDLVPMQYNAALFLLFSGVGLCAFRWGQLRLAQVLGAMVAVFAGLTLCEDLFSLDLGIDQFLFHSYITTKTLHPGRTSPAAAICLVQIGLALIFMGLRAERKWRPAAIGSLASIVIAVSGAVMVGYIIDLPGTYGWGRFTCIAPHTASCLALLGAGIFVFAWNEGRKINELTPRWLPVPMGLAVLAISLIFTQALARKEAQETAQAVKASAEGVGSIVNVAMEARIRSVQRIARRWDFSSYPSPEAWENYSSDFPDFVSVEWIDPAYIARWTLSRSAGRTGAKQELVLEEKRRTAMRTAREWHEPVITGILQLPQGGSGFVLCVPVYSGGTFQGCVAGLFEVQPLFDRYLPPSFATGYTITISEDGRAFYKRHLTPQPANEDWIFNSTVEQPGATWEVHVWPGPPLARKMDSSIPETLLFAGLFRAVILGLIIYLAQKSSAQARKTSILNHELERALAEVRKLSGMLPICAGCKRIRDDGGYWNEIERYVTQRSEASFSHGICPECAKSFYEEGGLEVPEEILKAVEKHHYDPLPVKMIRDEN